MTRRKKNGEFAVPKEIFQVLAAAHSEMADDLNRLSKINDNDLLRLDLSKLLDEQRSLAALNAGKAEKIKKGRPKNEPLPENMLRKIMLENCSVKEISKGKETDIYIYHRVEEELQSLTKGPRSIKQAIENMLAESFKAMANQKHNTGVRDFINRLYNGIYARYQRGRALANNHLIGSN